jgi:hypothetical protein
VTKTKTILVIIFGILISSMGLFGTNPSAEALVDGSTANCPDFRLEILLIDINIPDPAWVWVDPSNPFQSVSGLVTNSKVTHTDFPAVHDSHDQNTDILVDAEYEFLLSDVNHDYPETPSSIEMEWEIGATPTELEGEGADPTFPKWVWPNIGDRVWVDGHWIFDCGHPTIVGDYDDCAIVSEDGIFIGWKEECEHFRTEIHPARAIASMRDQVFTLPGTGVTPVRGVATDLYIHGEAGFIVDTLYCGGNIILSDDPDSCPTKASPIDEEFDFDIILPPKPFPSAILATFVEDGPGNSVGIAPILDPTPAVDPTKVHVTVPLDGSGVSPDDVYARKIYVAWVSPPEDLNHYSLTLNLMNLREDLEPPFLDCECTFFWLNVDRAPENEWIRLADFATGNMNDYDDEHSLGDGEMGFSGADFEYYVAEGMPVNIMTNGYDQDCLDRHFGNHHFTIGPFLDCYTNPTSGLSGDNDRFDRIIFSLPAPDYDCPPGSSDPPASGIYTLCIPVDGQIRLTAGHIITITVIENDVPVMHDIPFSEYDLYFTLTEIPLTDEDTADLSLTKTCAPGIEQSFICTIIVENHGPGLPRNVVVEDTLTTNVDPADYTLDIPTFTIENSYTTSPLPCTVTPPNHFSCDLGTVPVDGRGVITFTVTARAAGYFDDTASVTTDSTDPNTANNEGTASVVVVDLDIKPGDSKNTISINNDKNVRVAILGSPTLSAGDIDVSPLSDAPKFGGSNPVVPASASLEDVNDDGMLDLVMKFKTDSKNTLGFQSGDIQGCLTGKLTDGTPIIGCDLVRIIK